MNAGFFRRFLLLCLLWPAAAWSSPAPETTLLVVNADSPLSLTVANHWLELRPLPRNQVLWLHHVPGLGTVSVKQFRERILEPVRDYLEQRQLSDVIDTIVYSADFPYAVKLGPELQRNGIKANRYIGKSASVTGLTFFADQVLAGKAGYLTTRANHYFRRELGRKHLSAHRDGKQERGTSIRFEPPRGFSRSYHWSRSHLPGRSAVQDRYYLSAALAYTGQRGNSLPEIRRYLERSAQSDAAHPKGTVYLMQNRDVRSKTRQPWFATTCRLLKSIGHRCQVLARGQKGQDGVLPKNRRDIIGLVAGYRTFRWKESGSRLLPGAIAEALTSFGGEFDNPSQTKLTEFLRQGASGSSGAVSEPYAFPEKFPLPLMHYYYALGYSLGESWYQSVASPYQLILVGDPLTRPFAEPLRFRLESPPLETPWKGKVRLVLHAAGGSKVDHFEIWVDGRPLGRTAPGEPFVLDTPSLADGFHELHLVAVEDLPREARTSRRHLVRFDNRGLSVTLAAERDRVPFGRPFLLHGTAPPGSRLWLRQGSRELHSLRVPDNGRWRAKLDSSRLGMGPVAIQARIRTGEGGAADSLPLNLTVSEPVPQPPPDRRAGEERFELILETRDQEGRLKRERKPLDLLDGRYSRQIKRRAQVVSATIAGTFRVKTAGFHQLAIRTRGPLSVEVNGQHFSRQAPASEYGLVFVPLFLDKGLHQLRIQPSPKGLKWLRVTLAGKEPPRLLGRKAHKRKDKKHSSSHPKVKKPLPPRH